MRYTPYDWFWVVAGDQARAWSSRQSSYVADYPRDRSTKIASESELSDVLRPHGLQGPHVTEQDYAAAIQSHVDATAKSKGYADGGAIAGYSTSTIPAWAAEAASFVAWRDQVWIYAYTELAKVQGGQREQPTIAELVSELPKITWP